MREYKSKYTQEDTNNKSSLYRYKGKYSSGEDKKVEEEPRQMEPEEENQEIAGGKTTGGTL